MRALEDGGTRGTRNLDLPHARRALSQLSYGPKKLDSPCNLRRSRTFAATAVYVRHSDDRGFSVNCRGLEPRTPTRERTESNRTTAV